MKENESERQYRATVCSVQLNAVIVWSLKNVFNKIKFQTDLLSETIDSSVSIWYFDRYCFIMREDSKI